MSKQAAVARVLFPRYRFAHGRLVRDTARTALVWRRETAPATCASISNRTLQPTLKQCARANVVALRGPVGEDNLTEAKA